MEGTSHIEISRSALKNNLEFLKEFLGEEVRISSVVKGNAYGHGIEEYIPLAVELGIDHFSVFSADEAYRVVASLSKNPSASSAEVMIMGWLDTEGLTWAIEEGVSFFVSDLPRLSEALDLATSLGKAALVHIEVETGMNRTGFNQEDFKEALGIISEHSDYLKFSGLCTHYAGAESIANHVRVRKQIKRYKKAWKRVEKAGLTEGVIQHTACSAASIRYPDTQMDLVRIGILQYGFWPSRETFIEYAAKNKDKESPLWRIMSWKSRVMATKEVAIGEFIGYGTTYLAQKDMKIAIIPVGYGHGFSRGLSNQGRVLVRGRRHPVVGVVNMNSLAVDVTDTPSVTRGDEVILIGEEGDVEISVSSFSELSDQLNYELLTRLPMNIPRRIVK